MRAISGTEAEAILGVLTLVDLALTGSLLLIVIFSGYENFVSKIDHSGHTDWPEWMGTIDFTALKIKLLGSIVAISAIQLLKQFMAVKTASDRELMWYVIIHVVFVVSSVLLALSDRISGEAKSSGRPGGCASEIECCGGARERQSLRATATRRRSGTLSQEDVMQATINGIRMNYEVAGSDKAPAIVLHHPLATNLTHLGRDHARR